MYKKILKLKYKNDALNSSKRTYKNLSTYNLNNIIIWRISDSFWFNNLINWNKAN